MSTGDRSSVTGLAGDVDVHVFTLFPSSSKSFRNYHSVPPGPTVTTGYVSDGKSYHLHSCSTSKQQDFQKRSLDSLQLLEDPQQTECMTKGGFASLRSLGRRQGIDPLAPMAAQIAAFLYCLFDTHGLSPQTI